MLPVAKETVALSAPESAAGLRAGATSNELPLPAPYALLLPRPVARLICTAVMEPW